MSVPEPEYTKLLEDIAVEYVNFMNGFYEQVNDLHDKHCTAAPVDVEKCKNLFMLQTMRDFEKVLDRLIPPREHEEQLRELFSPKNNPSKN